MANEELTGISYDNWGLIITIWVLVIIIILFWYYFHQQAKLKREMTMLKKELQELRKDGS